MIAAASILVKGKVHTILAKPTAERVIAVLSSFRGSNQPVEARVFPVDNGAPALVGRLEGVASIAWEVLPEEPEGSEGLDGAESLDTTTFFSPARVLFTADQAAALCEPP